MNDEYKETVELTEDQLNLLNHVLLNLRDKAIYPYTENTITDIRKKVSEAESKAAEKRRGNRPNCQEDGHTWGDQSISSFGGKEWIIRGCNYCTKGQRRKSVQDDWETREMSKIMDERYNYECPSCGKKYKKESYYRRHVKECRE